jgi:Fic family protein
MPDLGQFSPLYPEERVLGPLQDLAARIVHASHGLARAGEPLAHALRPRLRAMNSYYSNRIEGQHTRPAAIEQALHKQFDADAGLAGKQRLAVAHMEVEQQLEKKARATEPRNLFDGAFVREIHKLLYSALPATDRVTDDGEPVAAGKFRRRDVTAGRHMAPPWKDVDGLVEGWADRYRGLSGAESLLIGIACSHHRLAWVHPFMDGNGRTARLHSHAVLDAMGLTHGLWSPMRGLARSREQYYARLNNADLPRRNDVDGRGALSQEELVAFARYFLETCLDQAEFMQAQLDFALLKDRLRRLLRELEAAPWQVGTEKSIVRIEALEPLHYAALAGPLERARFISMTGLAERTGRRVLASLLDYGVLKAESHRAAVQFSVPMASLHILFPNLWPEVETD